MTNSGQWITEDVHLPQELLDAHAEGRVVFFVGAGASLAAPSGLPLFKDLAVALGREAGVPYVELPDGGEEPLDRFLGRLTHLTPPYEVHLRTHVMLTEPTSQPNEWHDAIVRLASAYGTPRIITTNYDDHLDAAAAAAGVHLPDKWIGPALPLGHAVAGLVHLHGSVTRGHEDLVLTDKNLGQAYLSEAWATRFLLTLFQANVVVFIGYGLTDPTMRYLTLGLPSGASLYAFERTSRAGDPDWARLGVTTIPFGEDFDSVPKALSAWNTRARMGQLDHRSRIETLVDGGTSLTPVDRDYLAARLSVPEGARDFAWATEKLTDAAAKVEWLIWVESHPAFQELFARREVSDAAAILGNWFLNDFVSSPALHGAAFQTLERLGQGLSDQLFRGACYATWKVAEEDSVAAERWRAFLTTSIPGQSAPLDGELFFPFLEDATRLGVVSVRVALRPFLALKRRLFVGDGDASTELPDAEVKWAVEEYVLTPHLLQAVADAPAGDSRIGAVLEESLASAYDLLLAYHGVHYWDPLSRDRSAIETHEQDEFREPLDAIVDALRDYGIKAIAVMPEIADRWWSRKHALFQRLALHLVAADGSRSPDDKLGWVLSRTDLYPDHAKHELFRLLAVVLPEASAEARARVLAAVSEGPDYPEGLEERERHISYAKYNLLVWLSASTPDWKEAAEALASVQEVNPDFAPRDHPDFDMWMSGGAWGGKLPLAPEEFIAQLSESAATALDNLLEREYTDRHFEDPTWDDALTLVRQTVAQHPELGLGFWNEIQGRSDLGEHGEGLRRATASGWTDAALGKHGEEVVEHLASLVSDPKNAHVIGRFLQEQIGRQVDSEETPTIAAMRALAQNLWDRQSGHFTHGHDSLLSAAPLWLNSWPGSLAQYWPQEIDRRWRHNRENWVGLSEEEGAALVSLLSGPRPALDATRPAIARVLQFLFAADADFATEHVLPLFREVDSAVLAWHSYLYSPRWDDKLLAAGLLESMNEQWDRLDQLGDRGHRQQFFGLIAAILSWAGIDTDSRCALLTQSVISANGAHAADFAATVVRFLTGESVDGAKIWDRWLRKHVTDRLNGVPRTASREELVRWTNAIPQLGQAIPEAVNLLSGRHIGLDDEWFSLDIPEEALQAHGRILISHFVERLSNTTSASMMLAHRVRGLIGTFREGLGDDAVQPLVDAARDKGVSDSRTN
ncbi:SIR2 family protein [Oerskovia jenensis]|uniref:SIR2 family protein n=1 Tax=Oerskovia jenensis TaxID=162169 RepID=UPI0036DA9654